MKSIQTIGRKTHNLIFDDELYKIASQFEWRCNNKNGKRGFTLFVMENTNQ